MFWLLILLLLLSSCKQVSIHRLSYTFDKSGNLRIQLPDTFPPLITPSLPSDVVFIQGKRLADFEVHHTQNQKIYDPHFGAGIQTLLQASTHLDSQNVLKKETIVQSFPAFQSVLLVQTRYINAGEQPVTIDSFYTQQYALQSSGTYNPPFWSFQAASYPERPDWVLPLHKGFSRYNYQGMNDTDYGGGIPVLDIWTPEGGIAIGHIEPTPQLIALPVEMVDSQQAHIRMVYPHAFTLQPRDTLRGPRTFVMIHDGDFFEALTTFAHLMEKQGIRTPAYPETAYEPIWCAWGYGRNFNIHDILNTIPKVKELGLEWVVLDDGWQIMDGDWMPNPMRFPEGEKDMKAFVNAIHEEGLKAKLWWNPLAADPGSQLENMHPDWFLLNKQGKRQLITWWNAFYLCPAVPEVQEYLVSLTERFIKNWGYDGLKIDGQNLNAVPPCYNPAHHHRYPEESVEALPKLFKAIYNKAISLKPWAVVEICPCGTAASFYNMTAENQPVASDPLSSWQIRTKGKAYKALMGATVPYYGDHVELSDGGMDFASTIGIGGVVGTKFTWAPPSTLDTVSWWKDHEARSNFLSQEKEKHWKRWIRLYRHKRLAYGTYLGSLYDIGYDRPEGHVIARGDTLYYAFYAPSWDDPIELRGLSPRRYQVRDYVNDQTLGYVEGPTALLHLTFTSYLLLEAIPTQ